MSGPYNYSVDAVARSGGAAPKNMFATAPAGVEQKVSAGSVFLNVSIANNFNTSLAAYIPAGANGIYVIDCDCPLSGNYAVTSVGSIVNNNGTIQATGFNAGVIGGITGAVTAILQARLSNGAVGDGVYLYQNSGAALVFNISVTKIGSF
jgi:hypothetical protein